MLLPVIQMGLFGFFNERRKKALFQEVGQKDKNHIILCTIKIMIHKTDHVDLEFHLVIEKGIASYLIEEKMLLK